MVQVIRAGPYDDRPEVNLGIGYHEDRTLNQVEHSLEISDKPFRFAPHLRQVSQLFPHVGTIEVLEGGCGVGYILRDLKQLGPIIGRTIMTTGVDIGIRHLKIVEQDQTVDRYIIGTVSNAYAQDAIHDNQFHFILDFNGALFYDMACTDKAGAATIPIYGRVLSPGGTVLIYMHELYPESARLCNVVRSAAERRRISAAFLSLLEQNGLKIIEQWKMFALLQKHAL